MEHLWSRAGATGGNWWQIERPRKRPKQAKIVAMGCDQLPKGAHGKGAPPPRKGGGRLSGSARSAKSCKPEGPQDLTTRLWQVQTRSSIDDLPDALHTSACALSGPSQSHGNSSPGTPSETQTSSPTVVTSRGAAGSSIRATT